LESLKELGNEGMAESLSFGQIKSGEASHLFLNISLEYNDDRQYKIEVKIILSFPFNLIYF